jgi:hypothetical protein
MVETAARASEGMLDDLLATLAGAGGPPPGAATAREA